jgi:hypothetical protein
MLPRLVPMINWTFVLICDSFYTQWFVNILINLYLDLLEFEINEHEHEHYVNDENYIIPS